MVYVVSFRLSEFPASQSQEEETEETSIRIDNLVAGAEYVFSVIEVTSTGRTSDPGVASAVPLAPPPPTDEVPTAPRDVRATPDVLSLVVSWKAPVDDGGSEVSAYIVEYNKEGDDPEQLVVPNSQLSVQLTGLDPGVPYSVRVIARNAVGDSQPSQVARATPLPPGAPGPPTNVVVTPGIESLVVNFGPPVDDGGSPITGYGYTIRLAGESLLTATSVERDGDLTPTFIIQDLEPDTPYLVSVFAIGLFGQGTPTAPVEGTPLSSKPVETVPGVPLNLRITPLSEGLFVSWDPPASDGGSPIETYIVDYAPRGGAISSVPVGDETSLTLGNLNAGVTYVVSVYAVNAIGAGRQTSGEGTPLRPNEPDSVPSVPTNVRVIPEERALLVRWEAPVTDGGQPIESYLISYGIGGADGPLVLDVLRADQEQQVDASPDSTDVRTRIEVSGQTFSYRIDQPPLSPQVTYAVNVAAKNSVGTGPASVDIFRQPLAPEGPPVAIVSEVVVFPGDEKLTVTWQKPANPPSDPPILGYEVSVFTNFQPGPLSTSNSKPDATAVTSSGELSAVISNLENGVQYFVTVSCTNNAGTGPPSDPVPGTPESDAPVFAPSRPYHPFIDQSGDGFLTISWRRPISDGGSDILSYTVKVERRLGVSWLFGFPQYFDFDNGPGLYTSSGRLRATVFPLDNGTLYRLSVIATNAAGDSGQSLPFVFGLPLGPPDAPIGLTASSGENQASTLSWGAPPSDGGTTIDSYIVRYGFLGQGFTEQARFSPELVQAPNGGFVARITGLVNSRDYQFDVFASNDVGFGPPSNTATARPFGTVTSPPRNLVATAGDTEVNLRWQRPADLGGFPLQLYIVSIRSDNGIELARQSVFADLDAEFVTVTITDLTNFVPYEFAVQTSNFAGLSAFSNVADATPTSFTVPDAPTGVLAEPGVNDVRLSWAEPASDGGTPVLSYRIIVTNVVTADSFRVNVPVSSIDDPLDESSARVGFGLDRIAVTIGVDSLSGGDDYVFEVRAQNFVGLSSRSSPVETVPLSQGQRIEYAVREVVVIETTESTALLQWEEPFAAQGEAGQVDYTATFYLSEFITGETMPMAGDVSTATILSVNPLLAPAVEDDGVDGSADGTTLVKNQTSTAISTQLVGQVGVDLEFGSTYVFYVTAVTVGGGSPPSVPTVATIGAPFVCTSLEPAFVRSPPPFAGSDGELLVLNRANVEDAFLGSIVLNDPSSDVDSIFTSNFSALQIDEEGAAFVRWGDGITDGGFMPSGPLRRSVLQATDADEDDQVMAYDDFLESIDAVFPASQITTENLALNPGDASYSIAVWARLSQNQTADGGEPVRIVGKMLPGVRDEGGFSIQAASVGMLFEVVDSSTTVSIFVPDVTPFDDLYHMYVLTIDYDTLEVDAFIDGSPVGLDTDGGNRTLLTPGGFVFSAAPLIVGRAEESIGPSTQAMTGSVSEVSLFKRALSGQEVESLYLEYYDAAPGTTDPRFTFCADVESELSGVLEDSSGPPGPPFGVFGNASGNNTVSVSWSVPALSGNYPIVSYLIDVYRVDDDGALTLTETLPRSLGDPFTFLVFQGRLVSLVPDLEAGSTYAFELLAVNAAGVGDASEASDAVTPT